MRRTAAVLCACTRKEASSLAFEIHNTLEKYNELIIIPELLSNAITLLKLNWWSG